MNDPGSERALLLDQRLDPERLARIYGRLKPRLEEAHAELGVEGTFDRLGRSGTAERSLTVVDAAGAAVTGTWSAVGGATGDGDLLA